VRSVCTLNYRPMPGIDVDSLIEKTSASAEKYSLECQVVRVGAPLYTPPDAPLVKMALRLAGGDRAMTVPYGTDGMAYCQKMKQLIVLGPGDIAQAHTVDEWIEVDQLHQAVELYARFIDHVCVQGQS
jgi:acetylornithine deacetylase